MANENVRKRHLAAKKFGKYGPSTVYLQVLGSGARGVPNTLYLFTDQKRYLFNCGECTQRLAHEHKVKLSRLEHIFITSKTWANLGGLPGLTLTLQDVSVPHITLHGPDGLDELYKATSRFVKVKDMNVNMAKCTPSEDYEDDVMTVKYVLLGSHDDILTTEPTPVAKKAKLANSSPDKQFEEFLNDDTDYNCDFRNRDSSKDKDQNVKPKTKPDKDNMKKKTENLLQNLQKKTDCSVAFICTIRKRLGTLDLQKCVERGVKPGPLLGQLKSGQDVVLPDGTIVLSKDVKTPDDPGPVFIVLEVAEISYLRESEFAAHFDAAANPPEKVPALVVHFTPPHVFHHHRYRVFMAMFGRTTKHLVLNCQNSCLGSEAVHSAQHRLHLLDADMFPLLRDVSVPAVWTPRPAAAAPLTTSPTKLRGLEELKNKIASAQFQNIINMEGAGRGDGELQQTEVSSQLELIAGRTLTTYHLRPKKELDRAAEPKLHIQDYIQEVMNVDGFVRSLEQFRLLVDKMRYANKESQREYPKVVFLGTGSCIPSKTRNTSAILLQIDENNSMLLDCGEGTFGQLVRFFGPKRVNSLLRTLKAVYVSHLHADHHLGLIGVLQGRREAFEEVEQDTPPLQLVAPGQIVWWLTMYDQQFQRILDDFTLLPNQNLLHSATESQDNCTALSGIGVQRAVTCRVEHCPNAFGVTLELGQHKLTYSGDTVPSDDLVAIGQNSTLLIHEATLEDDLAEEARLKMHSTTSQAIDVGRRMNARYTLLTHFSQRYARLPRLDHNMLSDNQTVGIAFDNMQISMSDLELLPHMYAPLQFMFAEHCVELELKAEARARQKEKIASLPTSAKTNRTRSPSCASSESAPVRRRRVTYRDSNASRLRHDLKHKPQSAAKPGRSKSCTPWKRASLTAKFKGSDSLPHSPQRLSTVDKFATVSKTGGGKGVVNAVVATTKRTLSNVNYVRVINTRPKTINSASRDPSTSTDVKIAASLNRSMSRKQNVGNTSPMWDPGCNETGYGKPLVVPIDKKLTIRRESRPLTKLAKSPPPRALPRSPVKQLRAENNTAPVSPSRVNPLSILSIGCRARGAACTNVFTAGSKLTTRTLKNDTDARSIRSSIQRRSVSSHRDSIISKSREPSPVWRSNSRSGIPNDNSSITTFTTNLDEDVTSNKVKEHALSPLGRNAKAPTYYKGKFYSGGAKCFKPQLEDIKSSFVLLNQKNIDKNVKPPVKKELGLHSYKFGRITDYWLDMKVKQIMNQGPRSCFHKRSQM